MLAVATPIDARLICIRNAYTMKIVLIFNKGIYCNSTKKTPIRPGLRREFCGESD